MKTATKKGIVYMILILLVTSMASYVVNAALWDSIKNTVGIGGGKGSSSISNLLSSSLTSKEENDYLKAKEAELATNKALTPTQVKEQAQEALNSYKADKFAGKIQEKIGGTIGGVLKGVFGVVGSVVDGMIKGTPIEKSKNEIMGKIKFKTDLHYKIESVRKQNELIWNQACDELEKLQPGTKCERSKGATPTTTSTTGTTKGTTTKKKSLADLRKEKAKSYDKLYGK
jgi:hypothetical protein